MLKESKFGFPWISHRARLPCYPCVCIQLNYSILWSSHLNCDRHQLVIWSFVQQHKRSHQVLLLPIDGVCFDAIQALVVTKEYVAFLWEADVERYECQWMH